MILFPISRSVCGKGRSPGPDAAEADEIKVMRLLRERLFFFKRVEDTEYEVLGNFSQLGPVVPCELCQLARQLSDNVLA